MAHHESWRLVRQCFIQAREIESFLQQRAERDSCCIVEQRGRLAQFLAQLSDNIV